MNRLLNVNLTIKIIFVATLLCSVAINTYINDFDFRDSIVGVIFQLLVSGIWGYALCWLYNLLKQRSYNWINWWLSFYVFMVAATIILSFAGLIPLLSVSSSLR